MVGGGGGGGYRGSAVSTRSVAKSRRCRLLRDERCPPAGGGRLASVEAIGLGDAGRNYSEGTPSSGSRRRWPRWEVAVLAYRRMPLPAPELRPLARSSSCGLRCRPGGGPSRTPSLGTCSSSCRSVSSAYSAPRAFARSAARTVTAAITPLTGPVPPASTVPRGRYPPARRCPLRSVSDEASSAR